MITIIFLLLCAVEFIYCWIQWDQIMSYKEMGEDVAIATGIDKHRRYTAFVRIASKVFGVAKYLLIILIPVLLIINLIIASILGTILNFIF